MTGRVTSPGAPPAADFRTSRGLRSKRDQIVTILSTTGRSADSLVRVPPLRRLGIVVSLVGWVAGLLVGCDDAALAPLASDADLIDAAEADADLSDAAGLDADGGSSDAGTGSDASMSGAGDAGTPVACLANGASGTCLPTAMCGAGSMSVSGFCPGPADIQCCVPASDRCEATDVPLPNVDRMVEPPGIGACPAGMAPVEGYCVDRYEATLAEIGPGGALLPWSPYFNPGARTMRALSVPLAVPQGYINRTQAEAACTNAGKRLCTSDEWIRACEGSPATTFPYGDTRIWDRCNDRRSQHPAVEYFGTTDPWIYSEIDHPCLNQLPDSLALTSANAGCVSDEGLFDLVGNLHEWTLGTPSPGKGVFRGGFYVDTVINGVGCEYRTVAHAPSHWDYSTGFRCCADPIASGP